MVKEGSFTLRERSMKADGKVDVSTETEKCMMRMKTCFNKVPGKTESTLQADYPLKYS